MPADTTLPQQPSAHHGNGDAPYPCSTTLPILTTPSPADAGFSFWRT